MLNTNSRLPAIGGVMVDFAAPVSNVTVNGAPYITGTLIPATTGAAFSYTLAYTYGGKNLQFIFSKNAGTDTLNAFTVSEQPGVPTVTSSVNPSLLGQPVVLTASVARAAAAGTVTFSDGGAVICNAVPVVGGAATCSASFLSIGAHSISAVFTPTDAFPTTMGTLVQYVTDQRSKTVAAIGAFLGARNNQVLTNGPDGQRQIDRLSEAGNAAGDGAAGTTGPTVGRNVTTTAPSLGVAASRLGGGPDGTDVARLRGAGVGSRPIGDAIAASVASLEGTGGLGGAGLGGCGSAVFGGPVFAGQAGGSSMGQGIGAQHTGSPLKLFGDPCLVAGMGSGGTIAMNGMRFGGNLDGAMRFGFSGSLRDISQAAADSDARKIAEAGLSLSNGGAGFGRARANPLDIWVEGKYTTFSDSRTNAGIDGHFGVFSIGADYILNRSLLVGTMVQFDSMQQRSNLQQTDVRGHGWMAGPYATLRLTKNLFWQVRGAWGQSGNFVSPSLTYADSFDSTRWLVTSTVTGRWTSGSWSFRPSASISYMEDVSQSYADTFGVVIPSVKSTLGQAKAGPEIGYRFDLSHTVIEPRAGVQVIHNFASETSADGFSQIGGDTTGPAGARGRAEIGMRAMTSVGIGLDLSGSYDGIGTANYSAITGKAMMRVPLN